MPSVTHDLPVNSMTDQAVDVVARLKARKRDVAFHRAAQLLADATLCRRGQRPTGLVQMDPDEREWFKQAARNVIEIFEQLTTDRERDVVVEARAREAERQRTAEESRLAIERSRARVGAAERGHDLGSWHCAGTELGRGKEQADCVRCGRTAFIDLSRDRVLSGPALITGCLSAAGTEEL